MTTVATKRALTMKVAGRFIDLLGHQMYGGPVPAVAEYIANSWDADASKVEVTIPENLSQPGAEIVVRDHGRGMTFDQVNEYFLTIGYEKRVAQGDKTPSGRPVMGRKGIGKLAGFGIAQNMVIESVRDGQLLRFNLNYAELKSKVELQGFNIDPEKDEPTDQPNGVTAILKDLTLKNNINIDSFRKSMARRFALKSEMMEISINGTALTKENLVFEHRAPALEGEWIEEEIEGFGKISYWFGFLTETIKEKELRGVSVFARDRVAQFTPFHFNLSGGINGQVGLEYLTGQVKAETLDAEDDYVATPRQTINWQFGQAPLLEAWGQNKIKELCRDWKRRRTEIKINAFKHDTAKFAARIQKLTGQEREDIVLALGRIADLDSITPEEFEIIAGSMIAGVERESVKKIIQRINAATDEALPELVAAIKEWDIITAVSIGETVLGKLYIIDKLEQLIKAKTPEKSSRVDIDMQTFIKQDPWLLGQEYEQLTPADVHHEKGVDKWIAAEINKVNEKEYKIRDEKEGTRFDLLCMIGGRKIVIVELMRPGVALDHDHASRLSRYIDCVQTAIIAQGSGSNLAGMIVEGFLIADKQLTDPALTPFLARTPQIKAITWEGLLNNVRGTYKEFLKIQRAKAPEDPRLQGLIK